MKTLITGATGFLGKHLVTELCRQGDPSQLRALVRSRSERLESLGIEVVQGSVTSPSDVERALDGVSQIYHLAGFVSRKPEDAHRMYQVHVEGTRVLCQAAAAAGVRRMVLSSTSGTIAVSEREDEMLDESSPAPMDIIARWPYYTSKLYQEETARRWCGDKVELVMVNPSLLLGPGDDRLGSTREVLLFLSGDIRVVPGGGLSFVDVRDVAAALPEAMAKGHPGERYLLGGHNMSFVEFFDRIERVSKEYVPRVKIKGHLPVLAARLQASVLRALGRTPPIEPGAVEMAKYFWYTDSSKAQRELGFVAREASETLLDTVQYLRENCMGDGAFGKD